MYTNQWTICRKNSYLAYDLSGKSEGTTLAATSSISKDIFSDFESLIIMGMDYSIDAQFVHNESLFAFYLEWKCKFRYIDVGAVHV